VKSKPITLDLNLEVNSSSFDQVHYASEHSDIINAHVRFCGAPDLEDIFEDFGSSKATTEMNAHQGRAKSPSKSNASADEVLADTLSALEVQDERVQGEREPFSSEDRRRPAEIETKDSSHRSIADTVRIKTEL